MNLRSLKKIFVIYLMLAMSINSFALSAELRETECVPFSQAPTVEEDSATAEAQMLAFQAFQVKQNACRNDNGSFKNETIQFPPGDISEETEELDCSAMAEQAYMMSVRNNCDIDRTGLMSCITQGWDQRDAFDLFDNLQKIDQALPNGEEIDPFASKLGMKLEENFACPGKSEPEGALSKAIVCNLISTVAATIPFEPYLSDMLINNIIPESSRPTANECYDTENSCLTQALWGAVQNVFVNVQGLYDLGKMAVKGVASGANAAWGKVSRLWSNNQVEDASADQLAVAAKLENDIQNNEQAQEVSGNWAKRFVQGLMNTVGEGMRDQFSCSKWESGISPTGLASGLGVGIVNRSSSAKCIEAAPSWECATSKQQVQMVCGMIGFAGGEIVTTLLTGGSVRALSAGGKAIAKASNNFPRISNASLAVARGTAGLARGVLSKTGKGISVVATLANKAKSTGGLALKVGDTIRPMSKKMQSKYMQSFLGKPSDFKSFLEGVGNLATWYPRTLDRAYMLGRYGKEGSFALKNLSKATTANEVAEALETGMLSKNLQRKTMLADEASFRSLDAGKEAFENLSAAQTTLQEAQEKFLQAVKKARKGANSPDGTNLLEEADAALLAYRQAKKSLGPLDEAYTQALAQHQARLSSTKAHLAKAENESTPLESSFLSAEVTTAPTSTPALAARNARRLSVTAITGNVLAGTIENLRAPDSSERLINQFQYEITAIYSSGDPATCRAKIEKSFNDQSIELDNQSLSSEQITYKWFTLDGDEVCAGAASCAIPSDEEKLKLSVYKEGTDLGQSICQKIDSSIERPYDLNDSEDENGDNLDEGEIDRATEFFEQQRSPPPSLFQAAPIPRSPKHYLHSGYY